MTIFQDGKFALNPTEGVFCQVLMKRNRAHVKQVFLEYKDLTGYDIADDVKKVLTGDSEDTVVTLCKSETSIVF